MLSGLFQALCFCTVTRGVMLRLGGERKSQWNSQSYHGRSWHCISFAVISSLLLWSRKSPYCCLSKECDSPVLLPDTRALVNQRGCVEVSRLVLSSKTWDLLAVCPPSPCHAHTTWEHKGLFGKFLNLKCARCTYLLATASVQVSKMVRVLTLEWYCLESACKRWSCFLKKGCPWQNTS